MVYEVSSSREGDKNKSYALKRFFLLNPTAVNCALSEQKILRRLANRSTKSPFLESFYCSFLHDDLPMLVLSKGSGFDLWDVIEFFCPLNEEEATFYCSEIISGLIFIHNMGIVHLDIQPENILLSDSGHAIISDFDCAYDLVHDEGPPQFKNFRGTLYYMAPEVASDGCIRFEADTWGVGVVMASLLSDECRPKARSEEESLKQVQQGKWEVLGFEGFSKPLQAFLKSCFEYNPGERPLPINMKYLEIFRNIKWDTAELLRRSPPHQPSEMVRRTDNPKFPFDTTCEAILRTVRWKQKPKFPNDIEYTSRPFDLINLESIEPDLEKLTRSGMTPERISELFRNFEFGNDNQCPHFDSP